jgi:hypothetical protein
VLRGQGLSHVSEIGDRWGLSNGGITARRGNPKELGEKP